MLLDFIPCRLNCERIFIDPMAVVEILEEEMHIGPKLRKVARIVMDDDRKHLVLDDERMVAERVNQARLLAMDPDAFEDAEDA